jgi:hypothetical protein
MEALRKTAKHDSWSPGRDLKLWPAEYEAVVLGLTTRLGRPVNWKGKALSQHLPEVTEEKLRITSVTISGLRAEIWTRKLPSMKQEYESLCCDVRYDPCYLTCFVHCVFVWSIVQGRFNIHSVWTNYVALHAWPILRDVRIKAHTFLVCTLQHTIDC